MYAIRSYYGIYSEARSEFEALRESVQLNPEDSFRLANHLLDIGLYRTAIFAAREVLTLAGLQSQSASLTAPSYFNHVRYGLYYRELILPEEERYGLDPLFMFSVIRQESLFVITSYSIHYTKLYDSRISQFPVASTQTVQGVRDVHVVYNCFYISLETV